MTENDTSLFDLVSDRLETEQYAALSWEGSFADYLAIAERNPLVADLCRDRRIVRVDEGRCGVDQG